MSISALFYKQQPADPANYLSGLAKKLDMEDIMLRVEEDYTYSDGIRLHLDLIVSDKQLPTLVFIPGTAVYSACYAGFMVQLANAGYNVVGFDPRGHGRSAGMRGNYTIGELVRDTQAVVTYALQHFNPEVSLVGCSQGGIVAFYTAATDDRIKSAVCQNFADLADPRTPKIIARFPNFAHYTRNICLHLSKVLPHLPIPIASYVNLAREKVRHFGNVNQFLKQDPLSIRWVRFRTLHSLMFTKLPKPPEAIQTPLLVLQPGNDNIFPVSYTRQLFNRLTCLKRLHIFQGFTHTMMFDHPQQVAEPVLQWLSEIHPRQAPL